MRVALGEVSDVYVDAPRAAVFVNHQIIVLSELATAIVLRVREQYELSTHELATYLEEEFGSPDPSREDSALKATIAQISELQERGVLVAVEEPPSEIKS